MNNAVFPHSVQYTPQSQNPPTINQATTPIYLLLLQILILKQTPLQIQTQHHQPSQKHRTTQRTHHQTYTLFKCEESSTWTYILCRGYSSAR